MLAATTKIGSKYLVHIEILKALGAELENLPEKEKVMFDFKSAVVFLRPFLELAIKKNYTKDEIFQIMGKVGWHITQNTFKYFWSLFTLEEEASNKKKPNTKSAGKGKSEHAHSTVRQNEHKSQETIDAVLANHEAQSQGSEFSKPEAQNLNAAKNEAQAPENENPNEENPPQILHNQTAHISYCHLIRRIYKHANTTKFIFVLHRR